MAHQANEEFLGFGDSTPCEPCKNQPNVNIQEKGSTTGAGHNENQVSAARKTSINQIKAEHISSVYPPLSQPMHSTMAPPIIHDLADKVNRRQDTGNAKLKICIGLGIGIIILALTILAIWTSGTLEQKFKNFKKTKYLERRDVEHGYKDSDKIPLMEKDHRIKKNDPDNFVN